MRSKTDRGGRWLGRGADEEWRAASRTWEKGRQRRRNITTSGAAAAKKQQPMMKKPKERRSPRRIPPAAGTPAALLQGAARPPATNGKSRTASQQEPGQAIVSDGRRRAVHVRPPRTSRAFFAQRLGTPFLGGTSDATAQLLINTSASPSRDAEAEGACAAAGAAQSSETAAAGWKEPEDVLRRAARARASRRKLRSQLPLATGTSSSGRRGATSLFQTAPFHK